MKKIWSGLLLSGILVLSACGGNEEAAKSTEESKVKETTNEDESTKTESNEQQEKEEAQAKDDEKPLSEQDDGETYEEGFGKMKAIGVGYSDEAGIDGTDAPIKPFKMGSVNLYINKVGVVDVEPDEDMKTMFDDEEKVRAIIVDMKAENTSDEDVTFYPNQSIIVTDTGEQLESEMMFMGDAGGDFLGKVTKEGQTWWLVKNLDKDIKKITLIVSAPYSTDDWEDESEEKRIEFDVLTWEEAKIKDEN